MDGPWEQNRPQNACRPEAPSALNQHQRKRYLLFTFAFIGVVAGLILTGQFAALALILIGSLVYAPAIVEFVTGKN